MSETVTRDYNDRVVVQGDFLGDLRRMLPVRGDCGWQAKVNTFRLHISIHNSLDQLTGHVQGAFCVVENGFDDPVEELHAPTLRNLE